MQKQTARRRSPTARKPIPTSTDWERRHIPSPQLHESEKLLVGILAFLLVFLPWALGSTYLVAQAMACFIALTALGAALLPRHGNTRSITSGGQIKRLFSFPVFWLGSLLLLYISIQGFNTAWKVEGTDDFRILAESSHQPWLPAGVAAGESGPFQSLLIFGTPLLAVCAAWVETDSGDE